MKGGKQRTSWMDLDALFSKFKFHQTQKLLFIKGLERKGSAGPTFIILHTGAALRADGRLAKENIQSAISKQIKAQERNIKRATLMIKAWGTALENISTLDDALWRNPLWERELLLQMRREIKVNAPAAPKTHFHKDQLSPKKFRKGLVFRDVICMYNNNFSAFQVERQSIDNLFDLKNSWKALYPDVNFNKTAFNWFIFPKDISGNCTTAYLQFGTKAAPLAGSGNTQCYILKGGEWADERCVENWLS